MQSVLDLCNFVLRLKQRLVVEDTDHRVDEKKHPVWVKKRSPNPWLDLDRNTALGGYKYPGTRISHNRQGLVDRRLSSGRVYGTSVSCKCWIEETPFNVVVPGTENSTNQMKRLTGSPGVFEDLGDKV